VSIHVPVSVVHLRMNSASLRIGNQCVNVETDTSVTLRLPLASNQFFQIAVKTTTAPKLRLANQTGLEFFVVLQSVLLSTVQRAISSVVARTLNVLLLITRLLVSANLDLLETRRTVQGAFLSRETSVSLMHNAPRVKFVLAKKDETDVSLFATQCDVDLELCV